MNMQRRISNIASGSSSEMIALALGLRQMGVRRIFGAPGGPLGKELVAAARAQGITFVPTRHESAGVIAAGVTGELSGVPGVALVRQGSGLTNALAGLASMTLDRSPTLLICDEADTAIHGASYGQSMEPMGIISAMLKAHHSMLDDNGPDILSSLSAAALAAPSGPVLLELSRPAEKLPFDWRESADAAIRGGIARPRFEDLVQRIQRARRPVIVLGMQTRAPEATQAARKFAEAVGCPVFVTYKAKGVVPDEHTLYAGIFTGGIAEAPLITRSDLMLLIGVDPIEVPQGSLRYDCPVVQIAGSDLAGAIEGSQPAQDGSSASVLATLAARRFETDWEEGVMARHRANMRAALAYPGRRESVGPQRVVEMALAATVQRGLSGRATVDAGSHMISATTFWACEQPNDMLISHGPAASTFAIPAAIAASLHDPSRPVIAFVDEGGLATCLADLSSAVGAGARIVVVVFNDAGPPPTGGRRGGQDANFVASARTHIDFAHVMRGFGGRGISVQTAEEYAAALDEALAGEGTALIDVRIDPAGYERQMRAVRG
jgi:acetolactate synthase-1/2/3 large subunit